MLSCYEHCQLWLTARGLQYEEHARAAFARAHPVLFGRAYSVALRGYERWLSRTGRLDSVESFATYLGGRFDRWVASLSESFGLAELALEKPGADSEHVQQVVERRLLGQHEVGRARARRYAQ